MRLIGYVRASIDDPVDAFLSPEAQTEAIDRAARAAGHDVVQTISDVGVAGAENIETRTGLAAVFARARDAGIHGVIVARLDRLARDIIQQEQIIAELRDARAHVWSAASDDADALSETPRDAERALIRRVLAGVPEHQGAMRAPVSDTGKG